MSKGGSNKKVSNNLVALSSAAILAVYTAGYSRTQSAADRLAVRAEARRPSTPTPRGQETRLTAVVIPETVAPAPVEVTPEALVRSNVEKPLPPAPVKKYETPATVAAPTSVAVEAPASAPPVVVAAPVAAEPKVEAKLETPAAPVMPAPPAKPVWKDGTYTGWGYSRHGDIQTSVVIQDGKIMSTTIAVCNTRYSCSVIDELIPQPPKRQAPDVDNVSGATQSADAFYYGIIEALGKAK